MDQYKNFAYSTVAVAPVPAASGLSLSVQAGEGVNFPSTPFNASVWPAGAQPLVSNAEIVRVTGILVDALTIVRTQESTSARTIVVGDQIAATITAKLLNTDLAAFVAAQFVSRETPSGLMNGINVTFTLAHPLVVGSESVYLNGSQQDPGVGNDYTISGSTITYLNAPISTDRLRVSYFKA